MDIALKQRLVGASVLIALAVVVIPMLFGGRQDGSDEPPRIEVPEQPESMGFKTRRYPVGESPRTISRDTKEAIRLPTPQDAGTTATEDVESEAVAESGPVVEPSVDTVEPKESEEEAAEETPPADEVEKPTSASVEEAPSGRYLVQVASFSSPDNASRLAGRLESAGHRVVSDTVSSDVGTLHRVRVGPFATEADANRAVAAMKEQVADIAPRIVDLEPGQAAPVTEPSDPMVRWVVQVGTFSSGEKADGLVARLKLEGHSAYREAIERNGKTLYRVRVGPFVERDEAGRVNERVRRMEGFQQSVVMSAE